MRFVEAAVDGAVPARMIGGDAAFGNPPRPVSPNGLSLRPRRSRRRSAAAMPRLRRGRRRARRALRPVLGGDDLLRPALVRDVWVCLAYFTEWRRSPYGRGTTVLGRHLQ